MNLDDQVKLKFDRRLEHRRGWLAPGEREAHLEGLTDATDKIHDGSEDEAPEGAELAGEAAAAPAAEAPAAPAAPTTEPPTPEGGFGTPGA